MSKPIRTSTTAWPHLIRFSLTPALLGLLLTGCGTFPDRNGLFASGDGAPRHDIDIHAIPDATPRVEARSRYGNPASYVEFGKRYHVRANSTSFQQHGLASWYGTKFHGRRTSSGEAYDMYAMTAAHKTLPLPTWVEVINHANQRRIIVKVNDRGPFVNGRIIDLSYAAATKLGVIATGTARVTIRAIDPVQHQARLQTQPSPLTSRNEATHQAAATIAMPSKAAPQIAIPLPAPSLNVATVPSTTQKRPDTASKEPTKPAGKALSTGAFYLQVAAFSERSNAEQLSQRLQLLGPGKIQVQTSQSNTQALYRVRIGPLANLSEAGRIAAQVTSMGLGEPRILLD